MKKFDFTNLEQWTFEAIVYVYIPKTEETAEMAEMIMEDILEANNYQGAHNTEQVWDYQEATDKSDKDSRFHQKGTCDHCGAHFNYGAAFKNEQGEIAIVGNVCASTKLNLTSHEYADQQLRRTVQAAKTKIKNEKWMQQFKIDEPEVFAALHYNNAICLDICGNVRRYNNITPRQKELVLKIYRNREATEAREQKRKDEYDNASEVREGRFEIKAEVLGFKTIDGPYGSSLKMIIRTEEGWKAYGTVPGSLDCVKGSIIQFTAAFQASQDDPKFAIFKRPSKSQVLDTEHLEMIVTK